MTINSSLFLIKENIAYCQSAVVQSIQIENKSVDKIKTIDETEIGVKFDIDAKKDLDLYMLV